MNLPHSAHRPPEFVEHGLRHRLIAMIAATLFVASSISVSAAPASAAGTVSNNTTTKVLTFASTRYSATLSYDKQARFTSFVLDGDEVLDPSHGIYSALNDGSWVTSETLASDPVVSVSGATATITFSTRLASESWTVTAEAGDLKFVLSRTFGAAASIVEQGAPVMNFAENSFDSMRWAGDGGAWPIGGSLLNTYQGNWLATGARLTATRAAKEQLSYTLLNATGQKALSVTGTSNRTGVPRGEATEVRRGTNNDLRFVTVIGGTPLQYATGSAKGYASANGNGHVRADGQPVYSPVAVTAGQSDITTTVYAPADYDNYYDLGTLKGVDEKTVSRAIDYARWAMQDTNIGASTEASIFKSEVPALEMQWIGQLIELFPNSASIHAFMNGLEDIRDYLTVPSTGQIRCCRPQTGVYWGNNYGDQAPGYALGVISAYNLTGDATWLRTMAPSVRAGLDFEHRSRVDASGLVTNAGQSTPSLYLNNYWQASIGTYDGYSSALYYEALAKWAVLESNVLGSIGDSSTYSARAATLKVQFNKDLSNGGLWSPSTNTFFYGSGNIDALYLPVNAEVLKSDLASRARQLQIVQSIENQARNGQYDFHPMNVIDLYTNSPAAPAGKSGQNGGWYGAPDGDFYAGLPLLNSPQRLQDYISAFTSRYQHDGFYGNSAWNRANWLSKAGVESWFPTQVMPIWGLYHSAYGFQPQYDRLVLAPNIASGMVGSAVRYNWRGGNLSVTYVSQRRFTISAPTLATDVSIRWINQTPGSTVHIRVDSGSLHSTVVGSDGVATGLFSATDAGTHTFDCTDCTVVSTPAVTGTSFVTATSLSGAVLRNDTTNYVGFRLVVGSSPIAVRSLGRYKAAGNSQVHLLKIVSSSGQTVATTSVDMAAGTPDANGFTYSALPEPVTLAAGATYYIFTLEAKGGDTWYDSSAVVSHTGVGTIPSAAVGTPLAANSITNHSYGPVNFTYQPQITPPRGVLECYIVAGSDDEASDHAGSHPAFN